MDDEELFADLSVRLREAHRLVASLTGSEGQKALYTRRLLAISDASKHDLAHASRRLDAFRADLDAVVSPEPSGD